MSIAAGNRIRDAPNGARVRNDGIHGHVSHAGTKHRLEHHQLAEPMQPATLKLLIIVVGYMVG